MSGLPALATFAPLDLVSANRLVTEWGHYLGPCRRPFGMRAYGLLVDGEPVAVAISASVINHAAGYQRDELVELARLARHPDVGWASRVTLRLWRELAVPCWPYWRPRAAIAYSQNARHEGRLYRFDGWRRVTDDAGSRGGGTWSRPRAPGDVAFGRKTLWLWEVEAA